MQRLSAIAAVIFLAPVAGCECGGSPAEAPAEATAPTPAVAPAPKPPSAPDAAPVGKQPPVTAKAGLIEAPEAAVAVHGRVTWSKDLPAPVSHDVPKNLQQACGPTQDQRVVARGADNGVDGAIVRLVGGEGPSAPAPQEAMLTIAGCRMSPRAALLAPGGTMVIHNTDSVDHVFVGRRGGKELFTVQVAAGKSAQQAVKGKGALQLVGGKGRGWLGALIHTDPGAGAAVTTRDGAYRISPAPVGEMQIEVIHSAVDGGGAPRVVSRKLAIGKAAAAEADVELSP